MPVIPFDCEPRFFDRLLGLRRWANPDDILGLNWELVEAGGTAQIGIELARPFDDLAWSVQGGDIVEIWALGTGETVPRVRGAIGHYEKLLDLKERYMLTAYGRMEDMNRVVLDRILLHPGGADLRVFAGQIADDYAARRPGRVFVRDIQTCGISLERLEQANATARASMDQIAAQAGGNIVWGWDIDPVSGLDRFYLRPKTFAVGHQWFVGDKVRVITAPLELQNIANGIKVQGGPAKYPNLLTNPSFEVPSLPSEAGGDLLTDGGFEIGIAWHYQNGASRVSQHDLSVHNAVAHTGNYYAILDHPNEEIWQEVAVTTGKTYNVSLFAAREKGSYPSAGRLLVEGRQGAGGAVLETYTLPLAPASTAWSGGQRSTILAGDGYSLSVSFTNAAITATRVRVVADNGGDTQGLLIDDVVMADTSAVAQTAWFANARDGKTIASQFASIDWACSGAAWDGAYGVRVRVTPTTPWNAAIEPYPGLDGKNSGYHVKPAPQQSLREGVRVRMTPGQNGASGLVRLEYVEWAGDGHQTQRVNGPGVAIPNDGAWVLVKQDVSAHGDVATATACLCFGQAGVYDVDAFQLRDTAAGDEFLRGDQFERYVTAEEVSDPGSDAYNSFATYGRQEAVIDNKDIVNWNADAIQWAKALFQRRAVPLARPNVELTHEPSQIVSPGEGMQVRISGLKADLQDWCAKATYTWRQMMLAIRMDLSDERPTMAKLLSNLNAGGGGSTSSIAAVARGGANGGSTSTPAASYYGALPHTTTDATLHDDYRLGPHVADGERAAWNAKEPGLGNPGVNGQVLGSNISGVRGWVTIPPQVPPSWSLAGIDSSAGGAAAFNPGDIAPTWHDTWSTPTADLSFSTADSVFTPIAWEQHVTLATRLKVATAKTISISVTADNAARVLLNGAQVGTDTNVASGATVYALPLNAGWNVLQVCYQNGQGDSYQLIVAGVNGTLASLVDRMAPG